MLSVAEFRREHEVHALVDDRQRFDGAAGAAEGAKTIHHLGDQEFRGGGAGAYAHAFKAFGPFGVDIRGLGDEEASDAKLCGDLDKPIAVRRGGSADDQDELGASGEFLDGVLTVLGRVADIIPARQFDPGEARLQGIHDLPGVVNGKRRLGHAAKAFRVADLEGCDILGLFHQVHCTWSLAHGALDFDVAGVADHDHLEILPAHAMNLPVNLGDQGAGGVDGAQIPILGGLPHRGGNAVGAVDQLGAQGGLVGFVDENGALGAQIIDHPAVVDDFVAHVDRLFAAGERAFDDLDRAVHAGTKTPGICEDDLHRDQISGPARSGEFAGRKSGRGYTPAAREVHARRGAPEFRVDRGWLPGASRFLGEMEEMADLTPEDRFLRSCRGEEVDRPPVWLMRQAGRYLPEYRAVREGVSFLEMCRDVERAVKVSLQPIDLVGSEAVILFQDIFTPVPALGVDLDFAPGPVMAEPIRSAEQIEALRVPDPRESVPFVFEIIRTLRGALEKRRVPLLGFAGAPFTLAAYMVEGSGSRDFAGLKAMLHREPELLRALLATLTEMTIGYLDAQIEAGAQAVQLFDTWAGLLSPAEYREWIAPTHKAIVQRTQKRGAPLILYVNNGAHVVDQMADSGADVISLDWRASLADSAAAFGDRVSLQGNLDPCALAGGREKIFAWVRDMARDAAPARGFIANLGHGCLPGTPVEGVRAFTDAVRSLS